MRKALKRNSLRIKTAWSSYVIFALLSCGTSLSFASGSQCFGSTKKGSIQGAVQLPAQGDNFIQYSQIARAAGRTYVHSVVRDIVVASYQQLATSHPNKVFKYAETGLAEGGLFKPHKTHQNGLSIDFMTPVTNAQGQSVNLPTLLTNRWGYDIEFNDNSQYKDLTIDYEAMAAHIVALHQQSKALGYDLWRVIFDPKLQPNLFKTSYASYLKENIQFSTKRSWVRHDEHYHVDFAVPCK
ncbi:penicillin-insensitive murein endopeptidase [Pleionea litopenaei]|uniref:Penicillin-insensitive murein endopeptidase n=1 Tax=Pleionea litopenaei TaxID=3070815 RepID=A0AA51RWL0_9GAMM|nr:penicillin-insensitive murein endopeptidase [Pleionea sp. HL-JVS1]WMS88799.1 penicillin-insensitive murein endopeptidase [Pleionea sp. HL-JVS1]